MTRRGTRDGGRRSGSNAPRIATRRSIAGPPRLRAGRDDPSREPDDAAGRSRPPTAPASARAWSYPRSASRRRASGTHVTASAGGGSTATIASASAAGDAAPPRELQSVDRRARGTRVDERRPGHAHRRRRAVVAALDRARRPAAPLAPGRSEHVERGATPAQNGHGPAPQPAQRGGKTTSSARATTARR